MARTTASLLAPYAAVLDGLGGLTWPSPSRVGGGDPGSHRSTRLGQSPEFTEYRFYRPGDDLRRLDWKLYGRTDRLFLRIADDHATLRTSIVVDGSASMRFPLEGYGKWEHACAITMGLAAIATSEGDAVGASVVTGAGVESLPPRRRRDLLHDLAATFAGVSVAGTADLRGSLRRLAAQPRVVVISDFLGDSEAVIEDLRVLRAAGAEVFVIHVIAQEELSPLDETFVATDPEQADTHRTLGPGNRAAYVAAFASWRASVAAQCHSMQATYAMTSTAEPVRDVIRRVVSIGEPAQRA